MGLFKKKESIIDAIEDKQYEKARYLILNNGKINEKDEYGDTPLHISCAKNNFDLVEVLLKVGADVNCRNSDNWTPLHYAIIEDASDTVVLKLIKTKADINAKTKSKETPLHFASKKGRKIIVKALLEKGAEVNSRNKYDTDELDSETALHLAVRGGYEDVVKTLLEYNANIDAKDKAGEIPLHEACYIDNPQIANILVEGGSNILLRNKKGISPFEECIYQCQNKMFETMMRSKHISKLSAKEALTLVFIAIQKNSENMVSSLVQSIDGLDKILDKYYLIHLAVKRLNFNIIDILLKKGIDVNIKNRDNETPLHIACSHLGEYRDDLVIIIIAQLVNAKADTRIKNKFIGGETPIDIALSKNYMEVVKILEGRKDVRPFIMKSMDIGNMFERVSYDKFMWYFENAKKSKCRLRANDEKFNSMMSLCLMDPGNMKKINDLLNKPKVTILDHGDWEWSKEGYGIYFYSLEDYMAYRYRYLT